MYLSEKLLYEEVASGKITVTEAIELLEQLSRNNRLSVPTGTADIYGQNNMLTWTFTHDEPFLKDHTVFGEQVLLGVTHCSLAVEAALKTYTGKTQLSIHKLFFSSPVILQPSEKVEVSVHIEEKEGQLKFTNRYKRMPSGESGESASGEFRFAEIKKPSSIDLKSFISQCDEIIYTDQVYEENESQPIKIGPSLKNIQKVYVRGREILGELALLNNNSEVTTSFTISPSLLNGAAMCCLYGLPEGLTETYLPFMIKEVRFYREVPERCYCFSHIVKIGSELLETDIVLCDVDGTVLTELKGFTCKRVRSAASFIVKKESGETIPPAVSPPNSNPLLSAARITKTESNGNIEMKIERFIINSIQSLLGFTGQTLDVNKNFMDLGLDSASLVAFTQKMEKELDVELYPTLFFEYQNVKELASYFAMEHRESFLTMFKGEDSYDRLSQETKEPVITNKINEVVVNGLRNKLVEQYDFGNRFIIPEGMQHTKRDDYDGIAVIGMAGVFPDCPDINTFWKALREKRDLIKEIPSDHFDYKPWYVPEQQINDKMYCKLGSFIQDVDKFDAGFFNISPREASVMDPQMRHLLQVLYHTAEDAGCIKTIRGTRTGMYTGVCFYDYKQEMDRLGKTMGPHDGTGNSPTMMSNRPSFFFDLKGPSLTVDTACSSSLIALHIACKALNNNECDMAFVAGANLLLSSWHYRYFCSIGALSHTGRCHSFDEKADGYVPGEAIAAVLLKPLRNAINDGNRIHAVIKGSAINHGGYTQSITAPSVKMESQCIIDAWNNARIDPETIGYIEAHGTGTKLGDPVEINGLISAFRKYTDKKGFCAIGSGKAHIGHTEGAAGITGLIKAILSIQNKEVPAMPMFNRLNPYINLDGSPLYINRNVEKWERINGVPLRAGISSFGFGGANAHVVIEEYDNQVDVIANESSGARVMVLSAKNRDRLKEYTNKIAVFLEDMGDKIALDDIAYTLQAGREEMEERIALVVSTKEELIEKLYRYGRGDQEFDEIYQGNVKESIPRQTEEKSEYQGIVHQTGQPEKAARMWVAGEQPDWSNLYKDTAPQYVSLPTYPFEKRRYWIPVQYINKDEKDMLESVRSLDDPGQGPPLVYLGSQWIESPITDINNLPDNLLVFGNDEIYQRLGKIAKQTGVSLNALLVRPGRFYHNLGTQVYEINPGEPEDYIRLFKELKERNIIPGGILHLWQAGDSIEQQLQHRSSTENYLSMGVISVFCLIKALSLYKTKLFPKIVYAYTGGIEIPNPYMEAVAGYSRSISLLWPESSLTTVEVDLSSTDKDIANIALEEVAIREERLNHEVKYQNGLRYIKEFHNISLDSSHGNSLRRGGTYLITGGAGALGMSIARHLARQWEANLVLTGRSILETRIKEKIQELITLGANAVYIQADVASQEDMKEVVNTARKRFGSLNGVIHAAGTIDAVPVLQKDITAFRANLMSKIDGTVVVDEITREEPLDFFVMFSSISSVIGDFGQCDYSVGNRFMDGYARYRETLRDRNRRNGRTVSINWPLWRDGGMRGGKDEQLNLQLSGLSYLETQDGIRAFEEILEIREPQVIVTAGDMNKILGLMTPEVRNEAVLVPEELDKKTWNDEYKNTPPDLVLNEVLLEDIRKAASKILQLVPGDLDFDESFGVFGFDSITLKEFAAKIREIYNINLAPTIFFSQSSLKKLANYLVEQYGEEIREYYALPEAKNQTGNAEWRSTELINENGGQGKSRVLRAEGSEDIAIIGIGSIFPGAKSYEEFWGNILAAKDLITEIPESRWNWRKYYGDHYEDANKCLSKWGGFIDDVDKFDAAFFNISPREAELMDPQSRLFLETSWKAIEDGGYRISDLSGKPIGVFAGVQSSDYLHLLMAAGETGPEMGTGNSHAMIANRVSYHLNLRGPSESVNTACSSSLVAIQRAVKAICSGECEMALCGGVSLILSPDNFLAAGRMGMLSPDGRCKTFDRSANGFVKGEGVGVLLLKSLNKAREDMDNIYAVIKASAVNHGGKASSLTAPNPDAQADAIANAYIRAGIDPETITYIETHGTGTELGDPVEIQGLDKAFEKISASLDTPIMKTNYCGLGTVKTNIGHLEPAAGIAGIIKVVLALRNKMLPGNLHLRELNPLINLKDTPFYIVDRTKAWERIKDAEGNPVPRRAGVSSFGYGGTNTHVVLEEYEPLASGSVSNNGLPELIILSAKNKERLNEYTAQLADFLSRKTPFASVKSMKTGLAEDAAHILGVQVEDLPLDVDLREIGLNRIQINALLNEFNGKFRSKLDLSVFSLYPTINSLVTYLSGITENTTEELSLSNIAYTLKVGRDSMEERLAVVVTSIEELIDKLTLYSKGISSINGLYTGNSASTKERYGVNGEYGGLKPGTTGKDELERLARLWVAGEKVDWSVLYGECRFKRVSLPTYPFTRDRYWVPLRDSLPTTRNSHDALHPLIDTNVSTLEKQCFRKLLKPDEYFLQDHIVAGEKMLPGVVYLEMARKAGMLSKNDYMVRKIRNIIWEQPIIVHESPEEIFIDINPFDQQVVEFEVSAKKEKEDRVLHARGELVYGKNTSNQDIYENIDVEAIINRCRVIKTATECYSVFEGNGLKYGSSFQTIQRIYGNRDEAISILKLPGHLKEGFPEYDLHPALMDGATQTVLGISSENMDNSKLFLPFAMGEVELIGKPTEECYAYATLAGNGSTGSSKVIKYNILIADNKGSVVIKIDEFTVRIAEDRRFDAKPVASLVYCAKEWIETPIIKANIGINNILLFEYDEGIRQSLGARFEKAGMQSPEIAVVRPGVCFREQGKYDYEIDPLNPGDYRMLMETLQRYNLMPLYIIHTWSQKLFDGTAKTLEEQLDCGLYSLFNLCQTLIKQSIKEPVQLLYLYPGDEGPQPQYSGIGGYARTIRYEYPGIIFKTIEIKNLNNNLFRSNTALLAETAFTETVGQSRDIEVSYQDGIRFVRRLKTIEYADREGGALRHQGVYIITGGAGGLGLIFAEYLAKHFQARLVLVERFELFELSEDKSARIEHLKSMGGEVLYLRADVAKREDVQLIVSEARSRFGEINGILHGAGVIRDSFVLKKSRGEMEAVLAPKVFGTIYLDEATEGERLDFFVLFSSMAAVLGNAGQSDYAYANCFMDSFAERRNNLKKAGKRYGITLALNWPLWKEGGMKLDHEGIEWMGENLDIVPMSTANGLKAFEEGLLIALPGLGVIEGRERSADHILSIFNTGQFMIAETREEVIKLGNQELDLKQKAIRFLKEMVSRESKQPIALINEKEQMEKYGINSLMIMRFTRELEKSFGSLSKTLFFEYQNITDLADYFVENHFEKVIEVTGSSQKDNADKSTIPISEDIQPQHENTGVLRSWGKEGSKDHVEKDQIAIIGVSGRYPMAKSLEEFWHNLIIGKDCISEIPLERWDYRKYYSPQKGERGKNYCKWGGFIDDVDMFDPLFFGISPRDAEATDPQERLFLETVWQTLEDAGYTRKGLANDRVGVFVGVMYGEYPLIKPDSSEASPIPVSSYASIANRVSYYFDFKGPSIALDTMCSSSLTAIHLACESILRGESDIAIAGGVNVSIHPHKYLVLSQSNFTSSDGRCRSFGEGGDGYVPGEGVGALILKPLSKAIKDGDNIYALIKGSSINHGGRTNGYSVPNPRAQAGVIYETLTKAGINPRTISYIEAHGTGTSLGDPIEISGLINAFGQYTSDKQYCSIGSVKSNIGHLESAAGIAGITKVLLQMKYKQLVPSIHSESLNSNINFEDSPFYVQRQLAEWKRPVIVEDGLEKMYPRRAAISSFGAGGSNAHIILEEYEKQESINEANRGQYLFVLSATSQDGLKKYAGEMANFISRATGQVKKRLFIEDVVYTSQVGREAMEERLALVISSIDDLNQKLNQFSQGKEEIEGLYCGKTGSSSNAGILLEGRAGDEYVKMILDEGKMDILGRLWVSGTDLDWDLLYKRRKPSRISLPGYPFNRKRYWVDSYREGRATRTLENKVPVFSQEPDRPDRSTRSHVPYEGSEVLLKIIDDNIALIVMQDRKNRNMFSEGIVSGLIARLAEIRQNENIKAVILTGYDNIFSMGGTKEELLNIKDKKGSFSDASVFYKGLLECEVPVISAMQGHANGGGLVLGLFADIVIMSEESVYSASFMKYGFTPGLGATYILKEKLGANLATEMMFTARSYQGADLKNRAASVLFRKHKDVLNEAFSIAKILCEKPTYALKILKSDLSARVLEKLTSIIDREMVMHEQTFSNPEVGKRIDYYFDRSQKWNESVASLQEDIVVSQGKRIVLKSKSKAVQQFKGNNTNVKLIQLQQAEKSSLPSDEKVGQIIDNIVVNILHMEEDQLNRERNFIEIGVDSITAVEIIREINKSFKLELEAVIIYDYPTINKLAAYVQQEMRRKNKEFHDWHSIVELPVETTITYEEAESGQKSSAVNKQAMEYGRTNNKQIERIKLAEKGFGVPAPKLSENHFPAKPEFQIVREKVAEIVAEILHIQDGEYDINRNFSDLGVDSVTIVEIVRDVNKAFKLNIEAVIVYDHPTVDRLSRYVMHEMEDNPQSRNMFINAVNQADYDNMQRKKESGDGNDKQILVLLQQLRNGDLSIDEVSRLTDAYES